MEASYWIRHNIRRGRRIIPKAQCRWYTSGKKNNNAVSFTELKLVEPEFGFFQLHDVLYPGKKLPLLVFEPRYLKMIFNAQMYNSGFFGYASKNVARIREIRAQQWIDESPLSSPHKPPSWAPKSTPNDPIMSPPQKGTALSSSPGKKSANWDKPVNSQFRNAQDVMRLAGLAFGVKNYNWNAEPPQWHCYDVGVLMKILNIKIIEKTGTLFVLSECVSRVKVSGVSPTEAGYCQGKVDILPDESEVKEDCDSYTIRTNDQESATTHCEANIHQPSVSKEVGDENVDCIKNHVLEDDTPHLVHEIAHLIHTNLLSKNHPQHGQYWENIRRTLGDLEKVLMLGDHYAGFDRQNQFVNQWIYGSAIKSGTQISRSEVVSRVAWFLANVVSDIKGLNTTTKQAILECANPVARLEMIKDVLSRDLAPHPSEER
eukprot:CFRG3569T1